jgi:hypothetical protein
VSSPFTDAEREAIAAALEADIPGSVELGALDYVEGLLTALDHDPPHIWAAPAGSGAEWLELGPWERQAWAERIAGYRSAYERVAAGSPTPADLRLLHAHAAEGTYGDPAYGGNRRGRGWQQVGFPEPLFPPTRRASLTVGAES